MSKNPVLYKFLVVGVIVLFVGVGIQPAFAETTDKTDCEDKYKKNHTSNRLGFIICQVTRLYYWPYAAPFIIPLPLVPIICDDLDVGSKRIGITRLLGFHIFKFLPVGHDYKLTFNVSGGIERYIDSFGGFKIIKIHID